MSLWSRIKKLEEEIEFLKEQETIKRKYERKLYTFIEENKNIALIIYASNYELSSTVKNHFAQIFKNRIIDVFENEDGNFRVTIKDNYTIVKIFKFIVKENRGAVIRSIGTISGEKEE